ncbi:carbonic anhydrase-like [Artemia franciscana]|uniref:carbonic anhydrase-like n=1 Tax=Artemia franciscana TaxID=6661 RepID=UPI0032DAD055
MAYWAAGFIMVFLFLIKVTFADVHGISWGYTGDNGPDHWSSVDPQCGGSEQSPIDIIPSEAVPERFQPIFLVNYDARPKRITMKNNGHTAVLSMDIDRTPYIADGGLIGKYNFAQMHFHWGANNSVGSEHTLGGSSYAAELHLVHWNRKYRNLDEALGNKDGLTVLGIFIEATEKDNENMEPFLRLLEDVKDAGANVTGMGLDFALKDVLPEDLSKFYRYHGSLTTPSCNEVVFWTMFDTPVTASDRQLKEFRQLLAEDGSALVDNFRPPQNLGTRTVYVRAGAAFTTSSVLTVTAALIIQKLSQSSVL